MCLLGWVQKKADIRLQVRELLGFFGIARFSQLSQIQSLAPAWRKTTSRQACPYALSAWLRRGVIEAGRIQVSRFSAKKLLGSIGELRKMTLLADFHDKLIELCASFGVAVVFVPHLPKTYVNGAAYWLHDKAVVQLSIRYRFSDIVWFNFFHELGHICLHTDRKNKAFLDDTVRGDGSFTKEDPQREEEAHSFARDSLIPPDKYLSLLELSFKRRTTVEAFASQVGVHPGIVVGRLHHDDKMHPSLLNDLRVQLKWSDEEEAC
jgi:HTH-type transcriptional regulator / antitoxin HigA